MRVVSKDVTRSGAELSSVMEAELGGVHLDHVRSRMLFKMNADMNIQRGPVGSLFRMDFGNANPTNATYLRPFAGVRLGSRETNVDVLVSPIGGFTDYEYIGMIHGGLLRLNHQIGGNAAVQLTGGAAGISNLDREFKPASPRDKGLKTSELPYLLQGSGQIRIRAGENTFISVEGLADRTSIKGTVTDGAGSRLSDESVTQFVGKLGISGTFR